MSGNKNRLMLIIAMLLVLPNLLVWIPGSGKATGKETIRFWSHGFPTEDRTRMRERMITDFEQAYPDIEVKMEVLPWDQIAIKFASAHLAGKVPDVVKLVSTRAYSSSRKGFLTPLDSFIERSKLDLGDFFEVGVNTYRFNDIQYAIPARVDCDLLVYNKQAFREAGIAEAEKALETWDEFATTIEKLTVDKDNDGLPEQYGWAVAAGDPDDTVDQLTPWLLSNGGEILTEDWDKAAINTSEAEEALEFLKKLLPVSAPGSFTRDEDLLRPLFISRVVAMYEGGLWIIPLAKERAPDLEIGFTVMPGKKYRSGLRATGWGLVIPAKAEHKEAAFKFIEWYTKPEYADFIATIPARKASLQRPKYQAEAYKAAFEQLKYASTTPQVASWPEIREEVGSIIQDFLLGRITAKDCLEKAEKRINSLLRE